MMDNVEFRKAMQKRLDAFEKSMKKRGFPLKNNLLYDAVSDSVSAEKLLAYDNAEMFGYVSEHYVMKPGSLALRPEWNGGIYANHTSERFQTWEDVKAAIPKMMVSSLQDVRFLLYCDIGNDRMLECIERGELFFDPEVVLHLIGKGAFFTKIYTVDFRFEMCKCEKDVVKTMLVKDYCERILNKR